MGFKPKYITCVECNKTFKRSLKYTICCSNSCKLNHKKEYIKFYMKEYIKRPGVRARLKINHNNFTIKHPEKKKQWNKNWVKNNTDKVKKHNLKYIRKKRKTLKGKIDSRMATRLRSVLVKNNISWKNILGYDSDDLKKHLFKNKKFTKQDFLNKRIHIDHKTPISWFNYNSIEDKNFKLAWSLENLQLLSEHENVKKHNNYCADVILALSQL